MKQEHLKSMKITTESHTILKSFSKATGLSIVDILSKLIKPLEVETGAICGEIEDIENKIKSLESDKQSIIDRLLLGD